MYCTRLSGRIFKRLDRDEVDRGNVRRLYVPCRILGIGLFTTTTTFADERSVIKLRVGEYRDCNGSLCSSALFATGKKGNVYSTMGHHPLSFTVHVPTFPVGRNKSRLANTGCSTEVLLHSRNQFAGTCHAYLQRKVYSLNSRFFFPVSIPFSVLIIVYPKAVILTKVKNRLH